MRERERGREREGAVGRLQRLLTIWAIQNGCTSDDGSPSALATYLKLVAQMEQAKTSLTIGKESVRTAMNGARLLNSKNRRAIAVALSIDLTTLEKYVFQGEKTAEALLRIADGVHSVVDPEASQSAYLDIKGQLKLLSWKDLLELMSDVKWQLNDRFTSLERVDSPNYLQLLQENRDEVVQEFGDRAEELLEGHEPVGGEIFRLASVLRQDAQELEALRLKFFTNNKENRNGQFCQSRAHQ